MNILYGRKALLNNIDICEFTNIDVLKNHRDLILLLQQKHIPFKIREQNFFQKYHSKLNHQGVISYIKPNNKIIHNMEDLLHYTSKLKCSIILVVDGIQDPQNFGSILRTCEALGVDTIIYKKDNQVQINDLVIKSSIGATQHLNLIKVNNLTNTLSLLKKEGYWIYVSSLNNKAIYHNDVKYDNKTVIVVGNENKGVSKLICDNADFLIQIKMFGKTQSLNVAVATGILLSEVTKQLF